MKTYIFLNSNIQDISFLIYNVSIIIVISERKEVYNISISEISVCNIQITDKMHFHI
jgi:hypothetical protein